MDLIFNPCGEFTWSAEGTVSQIHAPHLHVGAPRIFSDFLRSAEMLKKEWGDESSGKLPHLFNTFSSGSEVRGFDPDRGRWIFSELENPKYDFLRKGSKAVGPVSKIYST